VKTLTDDNSLYAIDCVYSDTSGGFTIVETWSLCFWSLDYNIFSKVFGLRLSEVLEERITPT